MAKHKQSAGTLPAHQEAPVQEAPTTTSQEPATDTSILGTHQEPAPEAPVQEPLPAGTILDASGRPNAFLAACNARWAASSWDGHHKRIGTAGGPGTGPESVEPSRCYGCNRAWRSNHHPVVAADGNVWHPLCASLKDGGPGMPPVAVTRTAPVAATTSALAEATARLAALEAKLAALLASQEPAPEAGSQEPAA